MPGAPFLVPQIVPYPLAYGIQSHIDPRALPPPHLAQAKDVQFDETGGLQQRLPYAPMSTSIVGGGSLGSVRKVATYLDELLAFTATELYSYSSRDNAWALRGTYLAPKVTEEPVFVRSDDQVFADRAELSGVEITVWVERGAADIAYIAARDTTTKAVLLGPTLLGGAGEDATRPRIVAQATKFLLVYFADTGNTVRCYQIDPANLATSIAAGKAASTSLGINADGALDVAVASTGVAYVVFSQLGGAGYTAVRVTDAFARTTVNPGRVSTRIAVAVSPGTAEVNVLRYNGVSTTIRSDRLNPTTLADVSVDVNLGTPANATVNQLTAAYRTVQTSGAFRCYVFWSCGETPDGATNPTTFVVQQAAIDTAGAALAIITFIRRMGLASRAYDHEGRVYLWLVFAGESTTSGMGEPLGLRAALQNTYYLFRDEATAFTASPIAKAAVGVAGGYGVFSNLLPGVQTIVQNVYAWAGCERRVVPLNNDREDRRKVIQTAYADRGPRAIRLEMDSDEARRCVQLGRTLYIAGGLLSQYDGEGIAEVGFLVAPWYFAGVGVGGGGGVIPIGTYNVRSTLSWQNAAGDFERSTSTTGTSITTVSTGRLSFDGLPNLYVTAKKDTRHAVSIEFFRSQTNPPQGADMQLITSNDPAATGDNRYIRNDPTLGDIASFDDNLTDDQIVKRERNPENGGVLESLPPPAGTVLAVTQDRLFVAGISDAPFEVAPSKLRAPGEVAAFHDLLRFTCPPDGGRLTGLAIQSETIFAFAERAVIAAPGDGFDNTLGGENYGPARILSSDVGAVNQESIALTSKGVLFKSQKGWYLQQPSLSPPVYVGAPVAAFDSESVVAVSVVDSQHQVRVVTDSRILIWDYETNADAGGAWAEWTFVDNDGACVWQGRHVIVTNSGEPHIQDQNWSSPGSSRAPLDVETAWILRERLGWQKVWNIMVLGEYRGAHRLRIRVKYDYNETTVDDKYWTPSPTVVGRPLQVRHGPRFGWCEAMKIRLTAEHASINDEAPAGESLKLTMLALELGVEPGLFRGLPTAQKQ